MPVNLKEPAQLLLVKGIRLATAEAAIKRTGRADVALIALDEGTRVAATFTRNAFAAAPVTVAREHLAQGPIRALLINSGNANAGTGQPGIDDAKACCEAAAQAQNISAAQILPFSTGVIGSRLPVERIKTASALAVQELQQDAWLASAQAIMTTDTVAKGVSRQVTLANGEQLTITGIAKGSGMIRPDMATMLAFVGTDANIGQDDLQTLLQQVVKPSFNSITVDGDTSTNDACVLCATGQTSSSPLQPGSADWELFADALSAVMAHLAQAIIRDGEGATKFITLQVDGAADTGEARRVAFTVAHSPLVKTACFASDPNWGRILAAVGRTGLENLEISRVDIALDDVPIVAAGAPLPDYKEADAAAVMAQAEFTIRISLGRGEAQALIWTSDLSYEYVKINAEYRS